MSEVIHDDVWERNLRPMVINRELLTNEAKRYRMGSVRLALGRVKTSEEFLSEKKEILSKPLP